MKDFLDTLAASGVEKALIAKEIGVHRSYLYRLEAGHRHPTTPVVTRLLSFLNRPENLRKLGRRKPVSFEELFPAKPSEAA